MKTSADYKIRSIRTIILNSTKRKKFSAYVYQQNGIGENVAHFIGSFTAPVKTANKNLWSVIEESDNANVV